MEIAAWGLRYADESTGTADPVWIDAADQKIPRSGRVRIGILRLRRELVFRIVAGGAVAGGRGRHCECAGVPAGAAGTGGSDCAPGGTNPPAGIFPPPPVSTQQSALSRASTR